MILQLENISKHYQQGSSTIKALDNINFEMQKGETLAIIGPSGSGKSTLLSLLAGLDNPSSGSIAISTQKLNEMSEKELTLFRAQNIGIVFQQFHLMPYLSAVENISLPLEINHAENIEARVLKALQQVGLESRANHLPAQLSGGECQRIAIARALVTEPKILLADEPSGNLDTETGERIMDLLFEVVEKNSMTLVLVTHNLAHAKLCQRQVEIKAGKIQ